MAKANSKANLARDVAIGSAFFLRGPYAAHGVITYAVVEGPNNYRQRTATITGARRLAELLNHAHTIAHEFPSDIVSDNPNDIDAPQIVAWAVAKSLGWHTESPWDRKRRIEREVEDVTSIHCGDRGA